MRPQAEQTPVRFVDPDEKSGKTEQGYLRVMGAPGGDVVFDWKLSRKHDHLAGLVGPGYVGVLQSDGYGTYAAYAKKSSGAVLRVGCRAHARRKFFEARDENREKADAFLAQIGAMYAVESDCDGAKDRNGEPTKPVATAAGRATRRAEVFPAILEELKTRAKATPAQVRPRSRLGEACAYLLNQWEGLAAHATIGDSRLDNNLVDGALARRWRSPQGKQNAIRPSAVGKELALHRAPRRRPTHGDHLLHRRVLPTPRRRPARVPSRRAHKTSRHDHARRHRRTAPVEVESGVRPGA